MYVCVCQAITDGQIKRAVSAGVGSVDALRDTLGVASCCGSCESAAQELISDVQAEMRGQVRRYSPSPA